MSLQNWNKLQQIIAKSCHEDIKELNKLQKSEKCRQIWSELKELNASERNKQIELIIDKYRPPARLQSVPTKRAKTAITDSTDDTIKPP